MAKKVPHIVADCPNCNCPIEIQSHCMGHDTVCEICGEPLSVSDKDDGRLTVAASKSWHLPTFAEDATVQADDTSAVPQGPVGPKRLADDGQATVH